MQVFLGTLCGTCKGDSACPMSEDKGSFDNESQGKHLMQSHQSTRACGPGQLLTLKTEAASSCSLIEGQSERQGMHHDAQEVPDFSGGDVGERVVLHERGCPAGDALKDWVHLTHRDQLCQHAWVCQARPEQAAWTAPLCSHLDDRDC